MAQNNNTREQLETLIGESIKYQTQNRYVFLFLSIMIPILVVSFMIYIASDLFTDTTPSMFPIFFYGIAPLIALLIIGNAFRTFIILDRTAKSLRENEN